MPEAQGLYQFPFYPPKCLSPTGHTPADVIAELLHHTNSQAVGTISPVWWREAACASDMCSAQPPAGFFNSWTQTFFITSNTVSSCSSSFLLVSPQLLSDCFPFLLFREQCYGRNCKYFAKILAEVFSRHCKIHRSLTSKEGQNIIVIPQQILSSGSFSWIFRVGQ